MTLSLQAVSKDREIEFLKQSSQEFSRDVLKLEVIEEKQNENKEKLLKNLETKLEAYSNQNREYMKENYELKAKVQFYEKEVFRYENLVNIKSEENEVLSSRMSKLMSEVDIMLSEESDEAATTIQAYQEKLNDVRHSLGKTSIYLNLNLEILCVKIMIHMRGVDVVEIEMQKDKRMIVLLTDELNGLRSNRDVTHVEMKHMAEENKSLHAQVTGLKEQISDLTMTLSESDKKIQEYKVTYATKSLNLINSDIVI